MPELSALTQAHVPALNFQPINPAIYINPSWVPKPLPPDLRKAYQIEGHAAMIGAAAHAIGSLPQVFNQAYQQGQNMALTTQQNQQNLSGLQLKNDLISGNITPEQKQAMAGLTIGPTGATSMTVEDPRVTQFKLENMRLHGLTPGQREYQQANGEFGGGNNQGNPNIPNLTPDAPLPTGGATVPANQIGTPPSTSIDVPETGDHGKVTSYGYQGDRWGGPNSRSANFGPDGNPLPPDALGASPDVEAKLKEAGIGLGDKVALRLSNGQTVTRTFADRTAQDDQIAAGKIPGVTKPLRGRWDFRSVGLPGPDPNSDARVVGFTKIPAAASPASTPAPVASTDPAVRAADPALAVENINAAYPGFLESGMDDLEQWVKLHPEQSQDKGNLGGLTMKTEEPTGLNVPALSGLNVASAAQIPGAQLASIGQNPGASINDQPGAASAFGAPTSIIPGAMEAAGAQGSSAPALANMEVRRATTARLPDGTIVRNSFTPNTGETITPEGVKGKFQPLGPAITIPMKVKQDAMDMGLWKDGMTGEEASKSIMDAEKAGVIRPSHIPIAERFASKIVTHPSLKTIPAIIDAHDAIKEGLANPGAGGFSDMALIEGFQRMVNPGATVRTQTMENMKQAAGWLQQLDPKFQWEKAVQGDKFSPEARARLSTLADSIYNKKIQAVAPQMRAFAATARNYGIPNPEQFVHNTFTQAEALSPVQVNAQGGLVSPDQGALSAPAAGDAGAHVVPAGSSPGSTKYNPVQVDSPEDYAKVPAGTFIRDSKGKVGIKR